ncbi:hypothetical protein [Microcystis aeruginosa]
MHNTNRRTIRVCAAYFFGKIGCNGRLFVFLDKNNYFFKKTLFYFFVGYFILWKSPIKTSRGYSGGLAELLDVIDMLYENDSVAMQNLRKATIQMLPEEFPLECC